MSTDFNNPFKAPQGDSSQPVLGLSAGILDSLRQTRPWVLMMGILSFICAGLTILGGLAFAGLMAFGGAGGPFTGGMGIAMVVIYLIMGVLYIFPGIFLVRYANKISALLSNPTTAGLEAALMAQKSFWKFVGISVLVVVGMYLLIIIGGMFVGIASNMP